MKKIDITKSLRYILLLVVMTSIFILNNYQLYGEKLQWHTDYNESLALAKKESKPIFLFFTGSDWCGSCLLIEKEILGTKEFYELVGNKFIFEIVDFPLKKMISSEQYQKNENLKKKFKIEGVPTIIILSPDEKEIAILHYREGGPKLYAEYLLQLLDEEKTFNSKMKDLHKQPSNTLQALHERARATNRMDDAETIMAAGLAQDNNIHFLKLQYRNLLQNKNLNDRKVKSIKKQILAKDPSNTKHTHYDVAVLEFESLAKNLDEMTSAKEAIKPLQEYLVAFGEKDSAHRFHLEMMISHAYGHKNETKLAYQYAKASYDHAPDTHKPLIAQAMTSLEQDTSNIGSLDEE